MKRPSLAAGTRIVAAKNVGPVVKGHIGIVTNVVELPFLFWTRPHYLCTFLGNIELAMKPSEIFEYDHGRSLQKIQTSLDSNIFVAN